MTEENKKLKSVVCEKLKSCGFSSNSGKSLWIRDNGFYITFFEVRYCPVGGLYIEKGIKFLFHSHTFISYDYYDADNRITLEGFTTSVQSIQSERVVENPIALRELLEKISYTVEFFEFGNSLAKLKNALVNRRDLKYCKHFEKTNLYDIELAVILYIMREYDACAFIINNKINIKETQDPLVQELDDALKSKNLDFLRDRILSARKELKKIFPTLNAERTDFFADRIK